MGKGDKKTRRGKIINGSYGVRRPKEKHPHIMASHTPMIKQSETIKQVTETQKAAPKPKVEAKHKTEVEARSKPKTTAQPRAQKKQ